VTIRIEKDIDWISVRARRDYFGIIDTRWHQENTWPSWKSFSL